MLTLYQLFQLNQFNYLVHVDIKFSTEELKEISQKRLAIRKSINDVAKKAWTVIPKLAQASKFGPKEAATPQSTLALVIGGMDGEVDLPASTNQLTLPRGTIVTLVQSLSRPSTLAVAPSSPSMMEARISSPAPEGPPMTKEGPPEKEEGDWRLALMGPSSSIFRDYDVVKKLLDLIFLPVDREEQEKWSIKEILSNFFP